MNDDLLVIVVKDLDTQTRFYLGNDGELFLAPNLKNALFFHSIEDVRIMMRQLHDEELVPVAGRPPKLGQLTRMLARIGPGRKSAHLEISAQLMVPSTYSQFNLKAIEEISRPMDLWVAAIREASPIQEPVDHVHSL